MSERHRYHPTGIPLSEYIGPISKKPETVEIGANNYRSAVCIIGGGTGLEVLHAAKAFPDSAIVVIDPRSEFARKVFEQVADPASTGEINWQFFERSKEFQEVYAELWKTRQGDSQTWRKINDAYLRHKDTARSAERRIFFVDKFTDQVSPDEALFDRVFLIFPCRGSYSDRSVYTFTADALKDEGLWKIATDDRNTYLKIFGYTQDFVTRCGRVKREANGGNIPLSAYDLAEQTGDYYLLTVQKLNGHFPIPKKPDGYFLYQIIIAEPKWDFDAWRAERKKEKPIGENRAFGEVYK
ncbi:MAG: hypothetical protein Q8P25_00525 [Candidatus Curtissbacteria bacterium]|nr:hypothetical protein [Candidatus Curtissbacteria bacterium]